MESNQKTRKLSLGEQRGEELTTQGGQEEKPDTIKDTSLRELVNSQEWPGLDGPGVRGVKEGFGGPSIELKGCYGARGERHKESNFAPLNSWLQRETSKWSAVAGRRTITAPANLGGAGKRIPTATRPSRGETLFGGGGDGFEGT